MGERDVGDPALLADQADPVADVHDAPEHNALEQTRNGVLEGETDDRGQHRRHRHQRDHVDLEHGAQQHQADDREQRDLDGETQRPRQVQVTLLYEVALDQEVVEHDQAGQRNAKPDGEAEPTDLGLAQAHRGNMRIGDDEVSRDQQRREQINREKTERHRLPALQIQHTNTEKAADQQRQGDDHGDDGGGHAVPIFRTVP